jgi:hypothetical protein
LDRQLPAFERRAVGEVAAMKFWRKIGILGIALAGLILLLAPVPAFAQSCALCYTQAASSGARMIQALRIGILILIVPPTLGTIGVICVMYRKRNQVRWTESGDEWNTESGDGWSKD